MTGLKSRSRGSLPASLRARKIEFYVDTESRLTRLVHRLDRLRSLHVFRDGDAFAFEEVVEPPDVAVATASGVIDTSLFRSGATRGAVGQPHHADGRDLRLGRRFRARHPRRRSIHSRIRGAVQGRGEDRRGPDRRGRVHQPRPPDSSCSLCRSHGPRRLLLARWEEHAQGIPAHPGQFHSHQLALQLHAAGTRYCTRCARIAESTTRLREARR